MTQNKGKDTRRRRRSTKAPILDLYASEIIEKSSKDAKTSGGRETDSASAASKRSSPTMDTEPSSPDKFGQTWRAQSKFMAAGAIVMLLAGAAGGIWLYSSIGQQSLSSTEQTRQGLRIDELENKLENLTGAVATSQTRTAEFTGKLLELEDSIAATKTTVSGALNEAGKAVLSSKTALAQAAAALKSARSATELANENERKIQATDRDGADALAAANRLKAQLESVLATITRPKNTMGSPDALTDAAKAGDAAKTTLAKLSALALKQAELENKVNKLAAALRANPDLGERVDTLASALKGLQAKLDATISSQPGFDGQAVKKIETLAQAVKIQAEDLSALAEKFELQFTAGQSAAFALARLHTSIQAGKPYEEALSLLQSHLSGETVPAILTTYASSGLVTAQALILEFATVERALIAPRAQLPDGDKTATSSSVFSALQERLETVVKIRASGTRNWPKLVGRMARAGDGGGLEAMIQIAENVEETPPKELAVWIARAKERIALDAAVGALSARIMARLAKSADTKG